MEADGGDSAEEADGGDFAEVADGDAEEADGGDCAEEADGGDCAEDADGGCGDTGGAGDWSANGWVDFGGRCGRCGGDLFADQSCQEFWCWRSGTWDGRWLR